MIRLLICISLATLFASSLQADEGMFPISELARLNLQNKGMQLTPGELFNSEQVSLVDGICRVNGCTGSFVSSDGLIITNHHCAFDAIQKASTSANDLLQNGFIAKNRSEEVPASGYNVRITEGYSDVSAKVLSAVTDNMTFLERTKAIEKRRKQIEQTAEQENKGLRAEVAEMFAGKTYVLFLYTYLKDVRLVFAPPISIGAFGGEAKEVPVTAPATDAAKQWQGWGTALKPAHEPIVLARKPLNGTVANNVLQHGTGALNIDGCRVEGQVPSVPMAEWTRSGTTGATDKRNGQMSEPHVLGRWPANLIHDGSDEVTQLFPDTTGDSAARFFYCAKANKRDRNEGLDNFQPRIINEITPPGTKGSQSPRAGAGRNGATLNHHPTVKPTDLMRYLCRLITPPGGTILDPFTGSGSTGKAAVLEGFRFVGIEQDADYVTIAEARIRHAEER